MIDKLNIGDMVYIKDTGRIGYIVEILKGKVVGPKCYKIQWIDGEAELSRWTQKAVLKYKREYKELRATLLSHSATR
jgi:rRNA processing protein Gar1